MGQNLTLTAADGHEFGAYRADPDGAAKGGIVVLQEIFGVNDHIREVCDGFAADGFVALAPALYDRSATKNVQLGYTQDDIAEGRGYLQQFEWNIETMKDVAAASDLLKTEGLKVGTVGYCWGGSVSYLSGCRLGIDAAVVYYGGQIVPFVNEAEKCPLLMHFGDQDTGIPLDDVETIKQAHPDAIVHIYGAGHGFNCDHRGSHDEASAKLARERTIAFYAEHLS